MNDIIICSIYKISKFLTRNIMPFSVRINFVGLLRRKKHFNIVSSLYWYFGIYLCSIEIASWSVDFKAFVRIKLSVTKSACKNHVLFMRSRCAWLFDVISTRQKKCSKYSLSLQTIGCLQTNSFNSLKYLHSWRFLTDTNGDLMMQQWN